MSLFSEILENACLFVRVTLEKAVVVIMPKRRVGKQKVKHRRHWSYRSLSSDLSQRRLEASCAEEVVVSRRGVLFLRQSLVGSAKQQEMQQWKRHSVQQEVQQWKQHSGQQEMQQWKQHSGQQEMQQWKQHSAQQEMQQWKQH
jgi:hypothetical protein